MTSKPPAPTDWTGNWQRIPVDPADPDTAWILKLAVSDGGLRARYTCDRGLTRAPVGPRKARGLGRDLLHRQT